MNKISGKITHKETGIGIPDLLAVIYDVDPNTQPEESLPEQPITIMVPLPFVANFGDRLGSVLTDREGKFSLEYENTDFQIRNPEEKRPDIFLLVTVPEEVGQDAAAQILFFSPAIRQNAGRTETYLIRLTTEQLNVAGVPLPTLETKNAENASSIISRLNEFAERTIKIDEGLKDVAKRKVENVRARFDAFHSDFKPALIKSLSRLPENVIEKDRLVLPGESVLVKSKATIKHVIDDTINSSEPKKRAPRRGYLSLTDDQKTALSQVADPNDGMVSGEQLRSVLSDEQNKARSTNLLTREDPILQICREISQDGDDCAEILLGEGTNEEDPDEPETDDPSLNGGHVPGDNVVAITEGDIKLYLARLMETMTSPEEQVITGLTPRATRNEIDQQIKELSFKPSPADVPAFHDFHSLQIAFEHVWQEAIDEGILDLAQDAYDIIVENGGDPNTQRHSRSPVKTLFAEGRLLQTAFRRNNSNGSQTLLAGSTHRQNTDDDDDGVSEGHGTPPIDGNDTPSHQPAGGAGSNAGGAGSDHERLPRILAELDRRLREPYNFTIYAANKKERSVNFGIVVTYRQKWTPQSYQAGELVKTLTLAPKQTQKITVTKKFHKKRFRKEVENNLRSHREESNQTSRAEQEIARRASTKTNFSLTAQETVSASIPEVGEASAVATQSWSREASQSSDDIKKAFHEAVFKSAQEYKNETTTEVTSEETEDFETTEVTEISNPNDEIAVTFLFYELQRRYRVTEMIHQLRPVVFVAQEMPEPHEIDED